MFAGRWLKDLMVDSCMGPFESNDDWPIPRSVHLSSMLVETFAAKHVPPIDLKPVTLARSWIGSAMIGTGCFYLFTFSDLNLLEFYTLSVEICRVCEFTLHFLLLSAEVSYTMRRMYQNRSEKYSYSIFCKKIYV